MATLYLMAEDALDKGMFDLPIDDSAISYGRVTPGNTRVVARLSSREVQDIEDFFGEDAHLQANVDDELAWHEATLGVHDLRWWAGYR